MQIIHLEKGGTNAEAGHVCLIRDTSYKRTVTEAQTPNLSLSDCIIVNVAKFQTVTCLTCPTIGESDKQNEKRYCCIHGQKRT